MLNHGRAGELVELMEILACSTVSVKHLRFGTTLSSRHILPKVSCSRRDFRQSQQNDGDDDKGENSSTDWDRAWSNFRKRGKKTFFSQFNPNKYVTWNPKRSEFPLSEEVDPVKRTERSILMLWTSPRFTLGLAIVIVTLLLIYTIIAPMK